MTADHIQLSIAIILAFTAVILAVSLTFIIVQVWMQKRLLKAELLYDHFEMYVKVHEPVSDERIEELKLYPKDCMDDNVYEQKYKDNDEAIHKYIYMSDLYEYLAFSYAMPRAEIPSRESLERWTRNLCEVEEFREVHEYYGEYYHRFAKVVKKKLKARLRQSKSMRKCRG